ncbi:MAG: uL15 family ribosomal protein, partial [Bacteroidia bacterium]
VPKYGFKNINRIEYLAVNLDTLQNLADNYKVDAFDDAVLYEYGVISKTQRFKILGNGELKAKLNIKAHAFSKSAKAAIESAGGTIENL